MNCDTEFRGRLDQQKRFVALALLKLQEEGKINLYARLQDVAPEIPREKQAGGKPTQPVRIVNLLEHTAGASTTWNSAKVLQSERSLMTFRCWRCFKRFRKPQVTRWPPGTRIRIRNPGNPSRLLDRKSVRQPFDLYIRETFPAPAGHGKSRFPVSPSKQGDAGDRL